MPKKDPNEVYLDGSIGWEWFARKSGYVQAEGSAGDHEYRAVHWTVAHTDGLPEEFFGQIVWLNGQKKACKCGLAIEECGACGLGVTQAFASTK